MAAPLSEFPPALAGQSVRVLVWDRDLVDMGVLDAGGAVQPFRGKGSVWHAHAEVELTAIRSGAGLLQVGDHSGRFTAPDALLLGGELPHVWKADGPSAGISLQFRRDAAFLQVPELSGIATLLDRAGHGLRLGGTQAERLHAILADLPGRDALDRLGRLVVLLGDLIRHGEVETLSRGAPKAGVVADQDQALGRVVDHLLAHFDQDLRLADLVRLSGLPPATLTRRFRRLTGTSIVGYLHRLRIQEVQRGLIDTDRPVTDLALSAGFHNLAHFNAVFRRHCGCAPSAYRRFQGAAPVER